jgi:drug/metabolite transporter (DMT)-like permease
MRVSAVVALALIAAGAALIFSTDRTVAGADGDTIGAILLVVGCAALVVLAFALRRRSAPRQTTTHTPVDEPDERRMSVWHRQ